jgi:Protein of unknown function (DUF3375)
MDHADVELLRDRHPAWRLLRAGNATLVLTFLGRFFVEDNNGATTASGLAAALDDEPYALNAPDWSAQKSRAFRFAVIDDSFGRVRRLDPACARPFRPARSAAADRHAAAGGSRHRALRQGHRLRDTLVGMKRVYVSYDALRDV